MLAPARWIPVAPAPLPFALLAVLLLAVPSAATPGPAGDEEARSLFLTACAICHGESGDGNGTAAATLDRPARSFRAGGFSFGNTVEALYRTISAGIPGSPMPSFAETYGEEQRRALAAYVRTLAPDEDTTGSRSPVLTPTDRPLVVRGHLPPISDTAPSRPRGLLVGLPPVIEGDAGFTLEYRTDDLRLLGVRRGGFVERSDWSGRGGTPITPLGEVVRLIEKGEPAASWVALRDDGRREPLMVRFTGTQVRAGRRTAGGRPDPRVHQARVAVELIDAQGQAVAEVEEIWAVLIDGRLAVAWELRRAPDETRTLYRRWEAAPSELNGLVQRHFTGDDGYPWIEFVPGQDDVTGMATFVTVKQALERGR